jgi:Cdc6-like AAA superfamily ATPase
MITNPEIFGDDHIPRRLLHRGQRQRALSAAFSPALDGEPAESVIVSGSSGVGKTVLVKHTLHDLNSHRDKSVPYQILECVGDTTWRLLREAVDGNPRAPNTLGNESTDALVGALEDAVNGPTVMVLDEAGAVRNTSILARLLEVPHLSLVVVCHNATRCLARAAPTVKQAITRDVRLDTYGTDELADILEPRAEAGLHSGVVTRRQLEALADKGEGVARLGIRCLKAAAEIANERGHTTIEDVDVADCKPRARRDVRCSNLRSLSLHHQIFYALLHKWGPLTSSALNDHYDAVAEDFYYDSDLTAVSRRYRRDVLAKLDQYELIERGDGSDPEHRVTDLGVEPLVDVPERVEA